MLAIVLLLHVVLSCFGVTWGLPSRDIDPYLFGDEPAWNGETVYRLAGGAEKFAPGRGADVDVDPLDRANAEPLLLTGTAEDIARIYLRYRLYTYQPDEMITMMALAGMRPGRLELDPRLYQYGGLFIYPVGALIGLGGVLGLIDVRADVTYYLDHPDEFGKFYVVARGYAAAWGLLGVLVVFAIARRLGGARAAGLAALLFVLLPVVVCMAHEGKPHLPGAVLMLLAVWWGMKALGPEGRMAAGEGRAAKRSAGAWWAMCVCCGAAVGMVVSTWPVFVLVPVVAWLRRPGATADAGFPPDVRVPRGSGAGSWMVKTLAGVGVGVVVYLLTNPYLVINALTDRDLLRSNIGNSLAMYAVARIGDGLLRVVELTVEGATLPIMLLGAAGAVVAVWRRSRAAVVLVVPAAVFFAQFVLIGAGKPGEYGRFGVFTDAALAIGAACAIAPHQKAAGRAVRWTATLLLVTWVGACSGGYLYNFRADAGSTNSRLRLAEAARRWLDECAQRGERARFVVAADPAPYSFPPINFARADVVIEPPNNQPMAGAAQAQGVRLVPADAPDSPAGQHNAPPESFDLRSEPRRRSLEWWPCRRLTITPISWANKPFRQDWSYVSRGGAKATIGD